LQKLSLSITTIAVLLLGLFNMRGYGLNRNPSPGRRTVSG
jgi:hypothetical protein